MDPDQTKQWAAHQTRSACVHIVQVQHAHLGDYTQSPQGVDCRGPRPITNCTKIGGGTQASPLFQWTASSRPRHPYGLCPYGGSPYDPASYSACHIAPAIWDGFICSLLCGPLIWTEHIWHSPYGALYGRYHEKAAPMQKSAICANSAAGCAAMLHTNFRTIFCTNKSVQNFICRFLHRPYHIVGHMSKDERENRNSSIRMIHLHKKHI